MAIPKQRGGGQTGGFGGMGSNRARSLARGGRPSKGGGGTGKKPPTGGLCLFVTMIGVGSFMMLLSLIGFGVVALLT